MHSKLIRTQGLKISRPYVLSNFYLFNVEQTFIRSTFRPPKTSSPTSGEATLAHEFVTNSMTKNKERGVAAIDVAASEDCGRRPRAQADDGRRPGGRRGPVPGAGPFPPPPVSFILSHLKLSAWQTNKTKSLMKKIAPVTLL